jgi:hypothetical protein
MRDDSIMHESRSTGATYKGEAEVNIHDVVAR